MAGSWAAHPTPSAQLLTVPLYLGDSWVSKHLSFQSRRESKVGLVLEILEAPSGCSSVPAERRGRSRPEPLELGGAEGHTLSIECVGWGHPRCTPRLLRVWAVQEQICDWKGTPASSVCLCPLPAPRQHGQGPGSEGSGHMTSRLERRWRSGFPSDGPGLP